MAAQGSIARRRRPRDVTWRIVLLAVFVAAPVRGESDSLLVDVPASSKRCVGEQFPDGALGQWSFRVVATPGSPPAGGPRGETHVRVTVKDPTKRLLFSEALTHEAAQFPFTTKIPGLHKACIQNHAARSQRVALAVSTQGFSVKEYGADVGEKLGPISKQLDESRNMLKDIAAEMDRALKRETRERQTATATESRIETMGFVSMAVLIGLALWQIIYLRSFFRSKKLL